MVKATKATTKKTATKTLLETMIDFLSAEAAQFKDIEGLDAVTLGAISATHDKSLSDQKVADRHGVGVAVGRACGQRHPALFLIQDFFDFFWRESGHCSFPVEGKLKTSGPWTTRLSEDSFLRAHPSEDGR